MRRNKLTPEALRMLRRLLIAAPACGAPLPDELLTHAINALITGDSPELEYQLMAPSDVTIPIFTKSHHPSNPHGFINATMCILRSGDIPAVRWRSTPFDASHEAVINRINEALDIYAPDTVNG